MSIGRFLAGIGALIWNPADERYLMLRRVEHKDFAAGAWECVTGRVDQGESFEEALHREVHEEIGAEVQIEFLLATTHFYRGEKSAENELLGLVYGCTIVDPAAVSIDIEHSAMRWVLASEAYEILPNGHWLRSVIARAELLKKRLPAELRQVYRQEGFNI